MWRERLRAGHALRVLPVNETEFLGIQKEKKTYVRIAAFLVGLYMIYYGFMSGRYYASLLGVVVAAASLLFKDMAVTEKGIEIRYLLPGWHFESIWEWDAISYVAMDYTRMKPNVGVLFGRQTVSRIVVLKKSEISDVKAFARKMNPGLKISDEQG